MRGADKLLQEVAGVPLLRLVAGRAFAAGWPVTVTLPPDAPGRRAALSGLAVETLEVADAATGMAASFRALARTAAGPIMIVLADMPEIETSDIAHLIAAHAEAPDHVIRATEAGGRAGQPVVFPARLVPALAELQGDEGARHILAKEDVVTVPLPGKRATTDLDTPEAWAAWRAGRTG